MIDKDAFIINVINSCTDLKQLESAAFVSWWINNSSDCFLIDYHYNRKKLQLGDTFGAKSAVDFYEKDQNKWLLAR